MANEPRLLQYTARGGLAPDMMRAVLIFGTMMIVATVMLTPEGLSYVVNGVFRYASLMVVLLPIFAWPTFLIQAAFPPPGQGRGRALIGLWFGGAVLVSAVMSLLASMLSYSPNPLNFDPAGHHLLGSFAICMLLSTGVWGALSRVLPIGFVLKGAIGCCGHTIYPTPAPHRIAKGL
jgi:hypothetical protein